KNRFDNMAGMDEAKEKIKEGVQFLNNPEQYTKLGAKIPRSAVLSGSPGTGETLLAKATAGEAGVPCLSVWDGEFGPSASPFHTSDLRDMFATAMKHAPCIIFVDEIN
ncbi:hypothetical protein V8E36_000500, partial [Tilletia maclaganii]